MTDDAGREVSFQTITHCFFAGMAFAIAFAATSDQGVSAAPLAELAMLGAVISMVWKIIDHTLGYTQPGRQLGRRVEQRLERVFE